MTNLVNKYYPKSESIWDRNAQEYFIDKIDEYIDNPEGKLLTDTLHDIISLHYRRSVIQEGMWKRSKLVPASKFEWDDHREADGVPIFSRESIAETKENHKLHTAFDKKIVTNKSAYIAGQAPDVSGPDKITEFYDQSGFAGMLMEALQSATRGGNGYLLATSPEGENDVFLRLVNEWECVSLYDPNTDMLKYSIRYYKLDEYDADNKSDVYAVHLYTETVKHEYKYGGSWNYLGETLHLFEGVPLVEFANNTERIGDVELTVSLQDAFDILQSDLSSEVTQLRLAYLSLESDEIDIDEEWLKTLKQTGVFVGKGSFIEKNLNSDTVESLKKDLERQIYEYSNSYDPNALGSSGDITAYQIQQKLFGLEQAAAETIKMFESAIYYLFGLVGRYYNTFKSIDDTADFTITFRRNIPTNNLEDILKAVQSGFKISQKKMASLMPFEIDQEENAKELAEESMVGAIDEPFGSVPTGDTAEAVEVAKLSGIQISSANAIISQVSRGELSRDAGINQLKVFLGLTDEQANQVMGSGKAIKVAAVDANL